MSRNREEFHLSDLQSLTDAGKRFLSRKKFPLTNKEIKKNFRADLNAGQNSDSNEWDTTVIGQAITFFENLMTMPSWKRFLTRYINEARAAALLHPFIATPSKESDDLDERSFLTGSAYFKKWFLSTFWTIVTTLPRNFTNCAAFFIHSLLQIYIQIRYSTIIHG